MTRRRGRGSLLVMTLWLVTILTLLSVAIAKYLSLEIKLAKYAMTKQQALALARGGVYLVLAELEADAEDEPQVDWTGDSWLLPREPIAVERGALQLAVTDESGKLCLNAAETEKLDAALTALSGADIAQALIAYRQAESPQDPNEDQPEETPPYVAKDGMMMAMEEVLEIPAVRRGGADAYNALRAATTPYPSAGAPVNIHTAPAAVLEALGLSAPTIAAIEQYRTGPDGADLHEEDGAFESPAMIAPALAEAPINWQLGDVAQQQAEEAILDAMAVRSRAVEVTALVELTQPVVRARVTAVAERGEGTSGGAGGRPAIVRWMEQ